MILLLVKKLSGGSWQTEGLIIAMLFFLMALLWHLNMEMVLLRSDFSNHIKWHKAQEERT
jgi:hypothetical protein